MVAGAILATLVGTYFLSGERGARNRRKMKMWALKAKNEIMDRIEDTKLTELVADIRKHWKYFLEASHKE